MPLVAFADKIDIKIGAVVLACGYCLWGLVVYFALFKDRGFSYRLAGPTEPGEELVETSNFVKALRIAILFAGLMILPRALQNIAYLAQLPALLRALLFAAFGSEQFSHQLPRNIRVIERMLSSLIRLCLASYLIASAPTYVRWQVRKVTSRLRECDTNTETTGE
jgi:hypothetical protein